MIKLKIKFIILALILLSTKIISAAFYDIQGIGAEISDKDKQIVEKMMNYELEFFKTIYEYDDLFTIKITVFGDQNEYQEFSKKYSTAKSNTGYFSMKYKRIIVYKRKHYLKTVGHEMVHSMLREKYPHVPIWLNEGLAEYFEETSIKDNKFIVMPQMIRAKMLKRSFVNSEINLKSFFEANSKEWMELNKDDDYAYTLSWGIIFFLMKDEYGEELVRQIIKSTQDGAKTESVFENYYEGGIKKLHTDLYKYYLEDSNFKNKKIQDVENED